MGLQFFLGTGEKNLELALLREATQKLADYAQANIFYLVPNSLKFEMEIDLLSKFGQLTGNSETVATSHFQVLSFQSLAWHYLHNTLNLSDEFLSATGEVMLMRKTLSSLEKNLKLFKGEIKSSGFIQKLISLHSEFLKSGLGNELILEVVKSFGTQEEALCCKLLELRTIFMEYEQNLIIYGKSKTSILKKLTNFLDEEKQDLSDHFFLISGYSKFSLEELNLVEVLMKKSAQVKIALIIDEIQDCLAEADLFHDSKLLYSQCLNSAKAARINIFFDKYVTEELEIADDFKKLANYWVESNNFIENKNVDFSNCERLKIVRAPSMRLEVKQMAVEIRRLVVEENARYRDFVVLTRDLDAYTRLIEPFFRWHEIPFASEKNEEMREHPFVIFLQSLFAVVLTEFSTEDVFRLLRTELFMPNSGEKNFLKSSRQFRKKVDLTEEVVLKHGYNHSDWTDEHDWSFVDCAYSSDAKKDDQSLFLEKISNEIRRFIACNLSSFSTNLINLKERGTVRIAATIFYEFLVENKVDQQLLKNRDFFLEKGDLVRANSFEKIWKAFVELLDEYVKIFGEVSFNLEEFCEIFSTGLERLLFDKLPKNLDQVSVRSLEFTRARQAKYVFLLGIHEKALPQTIQNSSLLTDEERDLLKDKLPASTAYFLKDFARENARETYIAYRLFLVASVRLYFSFSEEVRTEVLKISPYLRQLIGDLQLKVIDLKVPSAASKNSTDLLANIATYRSLLTDLVSIFQESRALQISPPDFLTHLRNLLDQSQWKNLSQQVFASLAEQNVPENLSPEIAESLYGKNLQASVSRFEMFNACEYRYFLNCGLNLQERDILRLTPAIAGNFYHEVLDVFFKILTEKRINLAKISEIEFQEITEDALNLVLGKVQFHIFKKNHRMNHVAYELAQTMRLSLWAIKQQSKYTNFTSQKSEQVFGRTKTDPQVVLPLVSGGELAIRGKIDRLDEVSGQILVIDYKSSAKKFDLARVYHGLAMQMVTYLDVAQNFAKLKAAGSFYFHVHSPRIKYTGQEWGDFAQILLEEYQMQGFFVMEEQIIQNLDKTLTEGAKSLIYPLTLKKDGELISASLAHSYTAEEWDVVCKFNQKNFVTSGNRILSGELSLNPIFENKQTKACRYCPYRKVCKFDVLLAENKYRYLEKFGKGQKREILERMRSEL